MLIKVNKAIKPNRFLQFLNKNQTNNQELKDNSKNRNLCVRFYTKQNQVCWCTFYIIYMEMMVGSIVLLLLELLKTLKLLYFMR